MMTMRFLGRVELGSVWFFSRAEWEISPQSPCLNVYPFQGYIGCSTDLLRYFASEVNKHGDVTIYIYIDTYIGCSIKMSGTFWSENYCPPRSRERSWNDYLLN